MSNSGVGLDGGSTLLGHGRYRFGLCHVLRPSFFRGIRGVFQRGLLDLIVCSARDSASMNLVRDRDEVKRSCPQKHIHTSEI